MAGLRSMNFCIVHRCNPAMHQVIYFKIPYLLLHFNKVIQPAQSKTNSSQVIASSCKPWTSL